MSSGFQIRTVHALEKVFPDAPLTTKSFSEDSALLNEVYSFQVAYRSDRLLKHIRLSIHSELEPYISLQTVGLVPSEYPAPHDHDDDMLRTAPGLFPDPLYPYDPDAGFPGPPNQWRSVWVTVDPAAKIKAGDYPIAIRFTASDNQVLAEASFDLNLIDAKLPDQLLLYTNWFHSDCLATHYGVEIFSEEHWELIGRFVETASKHGMNMILTPLFTPPLDTAVGEERPTVQLVEVEKQGDRYEFHFDRLDRWIGLCREKGIGYFEMSHLFTQWGAKHAPKIMGMDKGEYRKFFGWETDAFSPEYHSFLSQFLPALVRHLRQIGVDKQVYFHVSDEPSLDHLESYAKASGILNEYIPDFPVIDALSNYDFYEQGLVKGPVPSNDHIEPFLENGVQNLWVYYCWAQYKEVSNRYMAMPSCRNRILGIQLYKFGLAGFLHWGYNFWYSSLSRKALNPYRSTDADLSYPSGDAFVVYPGETGFPVESIRLKVFHQGLQDMRALELLESRIGREQVLALLEEGLEQPLSFSKYPRDADWILQKRRQINRAIQCG